MNLARKLRPRSCAPVFVVGSARSGTTLLYDTLLSAGGFAVYLGESNIFNLLAPRFGSLSSPKNRKKMLDVWLGSRLYRVSGLDRRRLEHNVIPQILNECRNAGDFLRIVMDELANEQGAQRWAGNAPEEILHLDHIKKTIPEALVIHMIRDGRDVSVSLSEKRYIRPFPWKDREDAEGAALYWDWIVRKGREAGAKLGNDYTEVRFEDLVEDPRSVLRKLSIFLEHDLNYDYVQKNPVGAVVSPNSSFSAAGGGKFNPIARWKNQLSHEQLTRIEGLIGGTLSNLGYNLATDGAATCSKIEVACKRALYKQFFDLKLEWKKNPLIRTFRSPLTSRDVDRVVIVDDEAKPEPIPRPVPQQASLAS